MPPSSAVTSTGDYAKWGRRAEGDGYRRGRWWLPGGEDKSVGGDLRLSAEEFVLTTDGPLRPPETPAGPTITEVFRPVLEPVILGRTRNGDRLTLLRCDGVIAMIPGEMRVGEWRPQAALVGAHLDEDPRFVVVDIDLGHLEDLSRESGPSHSLTTDDSGRLARVEVAATAQAIAAGATEVFPVSDQPYGIRQGRVADPYGHHWLIGTLIQE